MNNLLQGTYWDFVHNQLRQCQAVKNLKNKACIGQIPSHFALVVCLGSVLHLQSSQAQWKANFSEEDTDTTAIAKPFYCMQ